ncbi:MAG: RepB family plasmid replication initiator protein [Rhizobiales bacterium]|nr:RepB family plasmid replication initiator protein [Hyphomicrobiales bacterium]
MTARALPLLADGDDGRRPARSGQGNVTDGNATFPKSAGLIQIREKIGALSLLDQKVLACMLFYANDEITDPMAVHELNLAEVRAYLGEHESNDRVREGLDNLSQIRVDFDVLGEEGRKFAYGAFVNVSGHEVGQGGKARYQFHHELRPLLREPAKWARVSLAILQGFQSKYAARLYENLELYANRRVPEWRIGVEDLRTCLGADGVLPGWGQLWRRALRPALEEVNARADFHAEIEVSHKTGRRVDTVVFRITKSEARAVRENAGTRAKRRREGRVVLRPETFERARRIAPGADIALIERDWRQWMRTQGKASPASPDAAFLGFVKAWYRRNRDAFV